MPLRIASAGPWLKHHVTLPPIPRTQPIRAPRHRRPPAPATAAWAVRGRVGVAEEAIAAVVRGAALSCYGVVDLASPPSVATLGRRLTSRLRGWRDRGALAGDGRLAVELDVVLANGLPAAAVARNLIATVSYQVERALGLPVERVDVVVDGLRAGADTSWSA